MTAYSGDEVRLDEYNSDLNFVIEADGVSGSSLHKNGFEYIWAGGRATHGVSRGRVCYEVLVQKKLEVEMPDTETYPHVVRVGWSVDASPFALGETPLSYGYGGTGKASCNNRFNGYGERYSTDDVITCYIDLDAVPKTIFFAKNGNYLGVAFRLGAECDGKVFYPHISVKNMSFIANFGRFKPYFPPEPGFYFLQHMPTELLSMPPAPPKDRRECEVLMMVGLPSCGKTTWLEKYAKAHPEKKYNVLGTNDILVKMKVMGLNRKNNYHGRWDALIKQASGILNEMLRIAKHKNRNYILDQTNVYPNARRRKMNNFQGYHRVAVVVVNTNSILMERNDIVVRQDGKVVPESAFMEMKANFVLPVQGEVFDEVWYVEEDEARSTLLVKQFNEEGRNWKACEKKRPVDDVQANAEPNSVVFKKSKHGDSTNSSQGRNQYGGHPDNNTVHPLHFSQGERPAVPCQESHPRDVRIKQESFQEQSQNVCRQAQYDTQYHDRSRQNWARDCGQSESIYSCSQETGHQKFGRPQQGNKYDEASHPVGSQGECFQPENYNRAYREVGEEGRRGNSGHPLNSQRGSCQGQPTNYTAFNASQSERGLSHANLEHNYNQASHRSRIQGGSYQGQSGCYSQRYLGDEITLPHGNSGNTYDQRNYPANDQGGFPPPQAENNSQRDGGERFPHENRGHNYKQPAFSNQSGNTARQGNFSHQSNQYGVSSQDYHVKQESCNSAQLIRQNENYNDRNRHGYMSSSSQTYSNASLSWNSPPQSGFNPRFRGHWDDPQGRGAGQAASVLQNYNHGAPAVRSNWNRNYYCNQDRSNPY